ncbi:MAG TPA: MerR family transcriptional regulator, partial [Acidimicrobiia bacterium]|nr:MerR family transcriptional regulator [Acidimicrobiia bacterium]
MSDEEFLTIDELAREAGTTVRNVRVYQDRGLLAPPERRGRIGLYGPDHLRRLRLVLRMLERGYPLAAIRELVEAWEERRDLGSVLGLEEAITAPYQAEHSRRVSGDRFRELLGGDEVAVARALETGLAHLDGDDVVIPNPRFFDVGLELLAGIPAAGRGRGGGRDRPHDGSCRPGVRVVRQRAPVARLLRRRH